MLVLSRRAGETIVIDGDIRVTVVEVQGNRVRLAIEAPAAVPVDRAEVRERLVRYGFLEVDVPILLPVPPPVAPPESCSERITRIDREGCTRLAPEDGL